LNKNWNNWDFNGIIGLGIGMIGIGIGLIGI